MRWYSPRDWIAEKEEEPSEDCAESGAVPTSQLVKSKEEISLRHREEGNKEDLSPEGSTRADDGGGGTPDMEVSGGTAAKDDEDGDGWDNEGWGEDDWDMIGDDIQVDKSTSDRQDDKSVAPAYKVRGQI